MNINNLIKAAENEFSTTLEDIKDVRPEFTPTGNFAFNALLSGSLYKGIHRGVITVLAGEESTGKTFLAIDITASFLRNNPDGMVIYIDTENAAHANLFIRKGADPKRIGKLAVATVEEMRTQVTKMLNKYCETPEDERSPLLIVCDSLGNLSTEKEVRDITDGSNTRDMTRAQLIRGTFRVLTMKLEKAKVPMVFTNHTYTVTGYIPTQEISGGGGIKYSASSIVFLSKSKDKDENKNQIGVNIKAKIDKSRFTREGKQVTFNISFDKGMDPYSGLLDIALVTGVFKEGTKIELPDGTKAYRSKIEEEPEKFFTKEVLDQIDEACAKEFGYGNVVAAETEPE